MARDLPLEIYLLDDVLGREVWLSYHVDIFIYFVSFIYVSCFPGRVNEVVTGSQVNLTYS